MLRSLLIPLDLSPASDRVVGRVARLPVAEGAQLTLLHVVPKALSPQARQRARADAEKALAAEAAVLARHLPSASVTPVVTVGVPAVEIADAAGAHEVELVVMGRSGGRAWRDALLGSNAERVVRRGQVPVLVVRLPPRGPYRRPALALDLDEAAHGVIELLLQVIPPPRPSVEVIHAYDIPYQGMIYPSLSEGDVEAFGAPYREHALGEIQELLTASLARAGVAADDAPAWRTRVRHGSARMVIAKAVERREADLLALGTRGYTGIAHALLGTVAGDVLRQVGCDVLVVPPRPAR